MEKLGGLSPNKSIRRELKEHEDYTNHILKDEQAFERGIRGQERREEMSGDENKQGYLSMGATGPHTARPLSRRMFMEPGEPAIGSPRIPHLLSPLPSCVGPSAQRLPRAENWQILHVYTTMGSQGAAVCGVCTVPRLLGVPPHTSPSSWWSMGLG